MTATALEIGLCLVHGFYFFVTGVWPLVSMHTFEKITGPKTDDWLVKTVGVLVLVIGALLLWSAYRRHVSLEIYLLAVGSAAGLTGIDIVYVSKHVISPIYLLDALAERVALVVEKHDRRDHAGNANPRESTPVGDADQLAQHGAGICPPLQRVLLRPARVR